MITDCTGLPSDGSSKPKCTENFYFSFHSNFPLNFIKRLFGRPYGNRSPVRMRSLVIPNQNQFYFLSKSNSRTMAQVTPNAKNSQNGTCRNTVLKTAFLWSFLALFLLSYSPIMGADSEVSSANASPSYALFTCDELLVEYSGTCNDGPDSFSPWNEATCISHASELVPTAGAGPASCADDIICIQTTLTDWEFSLTIGSDISIKKLVADFLYPIDYPTAGGGANKSHCPQNFDYSVDFFLNDVFQETVNGWVPADVITTEDIVLANQIDAGVNDVIKVVIKGHPTSSDCDLFELASLKVKGCCNPGPVCDGSITGLKIYDQATDQPAAGIPMLTNGVNINYSDLPMNYYIVAELDGNLTSAELTVNGLPQNCENIVPYTFPNGAEEDNDGGWNGGVGNYTLNVRAFALDDCAGEICDEETVSFNIVQDCVDFSVDAGPDETICVGEEVTLSATVTGATQCDCCVRSVSNTDHCNSSAYYALWIEGTHYTGNNDLVWEECGDGTARLTGTASNGGTTWVIDALFTGYSTTPPAGSPKENDCGHTNSNGWFYYTGLEGTLTNGSNVWHLERRGPSFQVGVGANVTGPANENGGSGWFTMTKGSSEKVGDFNIMLSANCSSGANCSSQSIPDMTYIGAYGNSHYYMKTSGDLTCDEAKSFVQARGGHLPKIETPGENEWLASQIEGSIWLSLTDEAQEGTWRWYDGEEAIYTNWGDGEPNEGSHANYARLKPDGFWTDRSCDKWFWVVMEVECTNQGGGGINDDISYLWSTGETTPSITVSPTTMTTYSVTVTGCDGCTDSDDVKVFVDGELVCPPDVDLECDESSHPEEELWSNL